MQKTPTSQDLLYPRSSLLLQTSKSGNLTLNGKDVLPRKRHSIPTGFFDPYTSLPKKERSQATQKDFAVFFKNPTSSTIAISANTKGINVPPRNRHSVPPGFFDTYTSPKKERPQTSPKDFAAFFKISTSPTTPISASRRPDPDPELGAWLHSPRLRGTVPEPSKGRHESRCLSMIVPSLFIAFEDDRVAFQACPGMRRERDDLRTPDGQEFTHVVELAHASLNDQCYATDSIRYTVDRISRIQRLHLAVPAIPSLGAYAYEKSFLLRGKSLTDVAPCPERDAYFQQLDSWEEEGTPQLTISQCVAARDFLASSGFTLGPQISKARILVITPRDDRTDAITVIAVFLAFLSGHSVGRILRRIEKLPTCLSVWKGVLARKAEEEINRIVLVR